MVKTVDLKKKLVAMSAVDGMLLLLGSISGGSGGLVRRD